MLPSKLQLQPHRQSPLLKTPPPPTRTQLLTSSWCRVVRWGMLLTAGCHLFLVVLASFFFNVNCIETLCFILCFFHIFMVMCLHVCVCRQLQITSHSLSRESVAVRPNRRTWVHSWPSLLPARTSYRCSPLWSFGLPVLLVWGLLKVYVPALVLGNFSPTLETRLKV